MRRILQGVIGVALVVTACAETADDKTLEQQLFEIRQTARAALAAGDSSAWRGMVSQSMADRVLGRARGSFRDYARGMGGQIRDDGLIPQAAQEHGDTAYMLLVGSPRMPFGDDPEAYQGEGTILMSTVVFAPRFVRERGRWKLDDEPANVKPAWMPLGVFLRTRRPETGAWPATWSSPTADRRGERGLGADDVVAIQFATDSLDLFVRMVLARAPVGSRELLVYFDTDHDAITGQTSGAATGPVLTGWERRLQRSTRGFEVVTAEERNPRVAVEFTESGGWMRTEGTSLTFRVPWEILGTPARNGFSFTLVDSFTETAAQVTRGRWDPGT